MFVLLLTYQKSYQQHLHLQPYLQGLFLLYLRLLWKRFADQHLGLEGPDATAILNTFIFNTFVFCQVFNEINSRDMEKINVFRGFFSSQVFIAVVAATIAFQVLSISIGAISMIVAVVLKCI
ncbi:primary active transporter [Lithospermum erythrorhizon]|uniref:Primary active transporter n=1 Tax=Lithospermum erythrorhizon TaxID=34254 RepID=A0AAV3NGF4_LITER